MKHRTLTVQDLRNTTDQMMNYTVGVKVYGIPTTLKVHIGLVGNHYDIISRLVAEEFGDNAIVTGAKITGKGWATVSPF